MWFEAVRRDGSQARFTRTGHDWIERVLAVIEAKRCAAAQVRFVNPIMMRAHHRSRARGVLFENNKPDAARHATSNDDTVLISGEPEAPGHRRPGSDCRGIRDFSPPWDWSRRLLVQHNESARQDGQDGRPHRRQPDE